jgi:hypothetical protein
MDGEIGSLITVESKNKKAAMMFDWLEGNSTLYPSYREDYLNFIHYCRVLNIDLEHDDMRKYNNEFMDNLVVTTLTPDSQYNQDVFDAIRDSGLAPVDKPVDLCLETINTYRDLCSYNEELLRIANSHGYKESKLYMETAHQLLMIYATLLCKPPFYPEVDKLQWKEGFLYYKGELLQLPVSLISKDSFIHPTFIISELGFCVHISDGMLMEMLTITSALDNTKEIHLQHNCDELASWEIFS